MLDDRSTLTESATLALSAGDCDGMSKHDLSCGEVMSSHRVKCLFVERMRLSFGKHTLVVLRLSHTEGRWLKHGYVRLVSSIRRVRVSILTLC